MQTKDAGRFTCETITREFAFIGQCTTANFPEGFPEAAVKVQREFYPRIPEIKEAKDTRVISSPYMCNGIVATYFACLEVSSLIYVPDGMIGFKLPIQDYAKISCTNKTIGEAYDIVFRWMNEQGYRQKFLDQSCPVEVYYLDEEAEEEQVEILIPIVS
ncbi:GyrI-like domain-containing protein [Paenibacillus sp. XY044]|uniref:GyrI-like domain-containing protein n=1 Tax=Paenibacillus sp. XY044 TaxID=2026089 RepID=UPI000B9983F7|nr:effector binding domain-containing protein [Paenibacillus sp. XY044]OZB95026.1 AraC family transcriptional regulator [Paenibacillus sp. XY044]